MATLKPTQRNGRKETSTQFANLSKDEDIAKALGLLAEVKQAQVTTATLKAYVPFLRDFEFDDVVEGVRQIMSVPRREGETAFPEVATILHSVRNAKAARLEHGRRGFHCSDCQGENGLLYFDRSGNRLRGVEIVEAQYRAARKCPCGGTEHDWKALQRDRAVNPSAYGTFSDVVQALKRKRPDLAPMLEGL
jgi:hypothetical protein